ncbi:DNA primase [Candidatus Cyrtobacter comes]|uniref:DNA primase n=1 Tax=Candidatus Cyrtobacter comes TaxID=675776 RepID=A0ABU5L6K0_9RICK|nr:DNA primase [Candidatus Cyrtobacter comes]MDZ5761746.1 DNA primase [Candidatus Cyrtobacter comes]
MRSCIDRIKSSLSLSSFASEKLQLKNKGRGQFVALCPFHNEKTPSFTIDDNKGLYHCFGCNRGGDILSFLMEVDSLSYGDALKILSNRAGIELPNEETSSASRLFFSVTEQLSAFYKKSLLSRSGALSYLKDRQLTDKIINSYDIGFSPIYSESIKYLLKNFSKEELVTTKLFLERDGKLIDPMSNRITFAIHNYNGECIAFGGRTLYEDKQIPKYINSQENPFFKKGYSLYGISHAKKSIKKFKKCVIVEGYIDVLSAASHGIINTVAPLGTAISIEQIKTLWNMGSDVVLCMDSDSAGIESTKRICSKILSVMKPQNILSIALIDGAKDPSELISKNGVEVFIRCLKNAQPLYQYLFSSNLKEAKLDSPQDRAIFRDRMTELANSITDYSLKSEYRKFFQEKCFHEFFKTHKKVQMKVPVFNPQNIANYTEEELFSLLISNIDLLKDERVLKHFIEIEIDDKNYQHLKFIILDKLQNNKEFSHEDFSFLSKNLSKERYISIENRAEFLIRYLLLHSLNVIRNKINSVSCELIEGGLDSKFDELMRLKFREKSIKSELGII